LFRVVTEGSQKGVRILCGGGGGFKGRPREEMLNGEMFFITILAWGRRRET